MPCPVSAVIEVEALSGSSSASLPMLVDHAPILLERHEVGARPLSARRHVPVADPEIELAEFRAVALERRRLSREGCREEEQRDDGPCGGTGAARTTAGHGSL